LIEINRRQDGAEGEPVRFGDVIEIVRRDDRRSAWHVLHQDRRITRNVFAIVTGQDPRPQVIAAAGGRADHDPDRLALVEGRLGRRTFKVQGVQKFKGQNGDESENLERLNH